MSRQPPAPSNLDALAILAGPGGQAVNVACSTGFDALLPRENAWLHGMSPGIALVMHWYRTSMWQATMTDPDPTDDRSTESGAVAPADAGTVLVVDDEPAIVESLT